MGISRYWVLTLNQSGIPNRKSPIMSAASAVPITLPLPPVESVPPSTTAVMRQEDAVKEISRMAQLSSMTVIGIGSMTDEATILKSNILTKNDFLYLQMQGAVGDVLSHFIDRDGNLVNAEIEDRLISTSLETLRQLKNVIGVAAGRSKVEAIRAALRGGYLDVLITDEDTALRLLETPSAIGESPPLFVLCCRKF